MRLSSSSPPSPFRQLLLKRNPAVSSAAVVVCICLILVPLAAGVKEPEIDLKTANHDHSQDPTTVELVAKSAAFHSRRYDSDFTRRSKPNKAFAKKYVDENPVGFSQGKEKKSIYDKKYFDYLPVVRNDPLETPTSDAASFTKRTNSRRLRRDTDGNIELSRVKRQGFIYPPNTQQVFYYPSGSQFGYNPGYRPQLYNQYLPPQVVHPTNPSTPDRTYLPPPGLRPRPVADPNTPFTTGNRFGGVSTGNRLGGHAFAFDTVYDPSVDTNYILQWGPRPSTAGGYVPNSFAGRPISPPTVTTARPLPPATTVTTSTAPGITTTTPRPVIQNNSDDDFDWASLGLDIGARVGEDNNSVKPKTAPSKCTWAIANCCSQYSDKIRYHCFEQNQCYGAFWGDNVCRTYYKLALTEIENYYNVL